MTARRFMGKRFRCLTLATVRCMACVASVKNVSPWVSRGLVLGGLLLIVVGILTYARSHAAFYSLLSTGVAAIITGFVLWILVADCHAACKPCALTKSASKYAIRADDDAAQTPPRPRRSSLRRRKMKPKAPVSLKWSDGGDATAPLEQVKTFRADEQPAAVQASAITLQPAHPERPRPMLQRPSVAVVPGYEPPFVTESLIPPSSVAQELSVPAPGPVFYIPESRYPDPDDIASERARFDARPMTPELDRQAKLNGLREAALLLTKRDPYMVPVAAAAAAS